MNLKKKIKIDIRYNNFINILNTKNNLNKIKLLLIREQISYIK